MIESASFLAPSSMGHAKKEVVVEGRPVRSVMRTADVLRTILSTSWVKRENGGLCDGYFLKEIKPSGEAPFFLGPEI